MCQSRQLRLHKNLIKLQIQIRCSIQYILKYMVEKENSTTENEEKWMLGLSLATLSNVSAHNWPTGQTVPSCALFHL